MGVAIFYWHFVLITSGLSMCGVLLGVAIKEYSDASLAEIGLLLMSFPFVSIISKPLFCSMADRYQAHKLALILSLATLVFGYTPYVVIPFLPDLYTNHPRISYYILAFGCQIGNCGLGVAWSLGDALAVNISQKTGTPFSHMKMMGTLSWGVFGYFIGAINESPSLPKFVPGFIVLLVGCSFEILLLLFWNNEDFEMFEANQDQQPQNLDAKLSGIQQHPLPNQAEVRRTFSCVSDDIDWRREIDSTPNSVGGTLRVNTRTAATLKGLFMSENLNSKLNDLNNSEYAKTTTTKQSEKTLTTFSNDNQSVVENGEMRKQEMASDKLDKNAQIIVLKMLLREDCRLIKYLILFTIYGLSLSPGLFMFLSLSEVCTQRECNFSRLAGTLLVAQSASETISFFAVPLLMKYMRRRTALSFCFLINVGRFGFYIYFFSNDNVHPYWAVFAECFMGVSYATAYSILAALGLMFADQAKFFIPELRRMGYLSEQRDGNEAQVQKEENKIKMALRATMQSIFSGCSDGLGNGCGNFLSGEIVQAFTFVALWEVFTVISAVSLLLYGVIEFSRSRFSDSYNAKPGTKAYEILTFEEEQRKLAKEPLQKQ